MRKRIVIAAVLTIALISGIACSQERKKAPAGKEKSADKEKLADKKEVAPLVTFVEIGSVKLHPLQEDAADHEGDRAGVRGQGQGRVLRRVDS